MKSLRVTPPEIDKHTFEIRRNHIYNLRLTLITVVFVVWALALIFMDRSLFL